jgi:hypothetical protein
MHPLHGIATGSAAQFEVERPSESLAQINLPRTDSFHYCLETIHLHNVSLGQVEGKS